MADSAALERLPHQPVLYHESINLLQPKSRGRYIDGTLGAGGHTAGILAASDPDGKIIGLDVDRKALEIAQARLSAFSSRAVLINGSFADMNDHLRATGWVCVDGVLLDLGLSSMQLDTAERGFSFIKDAPLDMRFDTSQALTAGEIANTWSEEDLARIIFEYGEEPRSRQIAAAISANRPLATTGQLAAVIEKAHKRKRGKIHPATRTFQAFRMAVNHELDTLASGLTQALSALCPGGRLVVISFHSLEDRMVKHFFQRESRDCLCLPEQLVCICGHKASLKLMTRKAIKPSEEEIRMNPRSRSAKLRAAEKL